MPWLKRVWLLWLVERQYAWMSKTFSGLLARVAAIASLFVLCAQLLLLFLGSLAWVAYSLLKDHGLTAGQAGLILAAAILVLLASAIFTIRRACRDLHVAMDHQLHKKASVSHTVGRVTDGFIDGLVKSKH